MSGLLVLFSFNQREEGLQICTASNYECCLPLVYGAGLKSRGRFWVLLEIFSSPVRVMYLFQLSWRGTTEENWLGSEWHSSIYSMIHR